MTDSLHPTRTALVLGGGGSTGNAWLIGVIAGLFRAGVDVTTADLTIGTSAGATAAAQVTGAPPPELYAAILDTVLPARPSGSSGRPSGPPVNTHLEKTGAIIAASRDPADMRRRMGAAAFEVDAESDGSWTAQWRSTVAPRLPRSTWPQQRLAITAVDAATGEGVVFDSDSGVDLVDAVAASTSGGPNPYRIGDRRYIDGGYRTNAENADLASGFERVLVLSPFGGRTRWPLEWGIHLAPQVDELRAQGSRVEIVSPADRAEHLFGVNGMDLSLRPAAARVGFEQGIDLAEPLGAFWRAR
jgi:NTE family protein